MCAEFFEGIAKTFFFITNFLVFILATVVLGLSIWVLADKPSFVSLTDSIDVGIKVYDSACVVFVVLATLTMIVTFFGCCGLSKNSRCMLATFFVLACLLLVGVGVGAYLSFYGDFDTLKEPLKRLMRKYDPDGTSEAEKTLVKSWDEFQQDFKCCGLDGWKDWSKYNDHFAQNDTSATKPKPWVPKSCCSTKKDCRYNPTTNDGTYTEGCFAKMKKKIEENSDEIGGASIAVFVVMALNCFIAGYMATCGQGSIG